MALQLASSVDCLRGVCAWPSYQTVVYLILLSLKLKTENRQVLDPVSYDLMTQGHTD